MQQIGWRLNTEFRHGTLPHQPGVPQLQRITLNRNKIGNTDKLLFSYPLRERKPRAAKVWQARKNWRSRSSRTPAPVEKTLPGREQNFIREQTDHDDDEHDTDNLVHGI